MREERRGEPEANQRLTVAQAAAKLGITEGAVRSRIKRGTIPTIKEGGTVYVVLGGGTSPPNHPPYTAEPSGAPSDQSELVENLREQVAYLQGVIATRDRELAQRGEEIRRRDQALEREQQLTAMFADRLRELQAPQEPQNQAEKAEPQSDRVHHPRSRRRPQSGGACGVGSSGGNTAGANCLSS